MANVQSVQIVLSVQVSSAELLKLRARYSFKVLFQCTSAICSSSLVEAALQLLDTPRGSVCAGGSHAHAAAGSGAPST